MKKLYLITLIINVCILSATAQTSAKQNAQQPADSIKIREFGIRKRLKKLWE